MKEGDYESFKQFTNRSLSVKHQIEQSKNQIVQEKVQEPIHVLPKIQDVIPVQEELAMT